VASNLTFPDSVYVYNENVKGVDFKSLERFIKKNFGKISLKVIRIKEKIVATKGVLFDPVKTKTNFDKVIHSRSPGLSLGYGCNVILTDKLIATFDEDKKLHIRASIYSFPSIISISGIVEGPAKPKDYYLYKDRFTKLGVWEIEEPKIKKRFKTRFIDYGDRRMTEVLKGYVSQALFFHITGNPFCEKRYCRLFNSHWQEGLIHSQVKVGKFCRHHKKQLCILQFSKH